MVRKIANAVKTARQPASSNVPPGTSNITMLVRRRDQSGGAEDHQYRYVFVDSIESFTKSRAARQSPPNNANIYSTQEYGQPEDTTYARLEYP